MLLTTATSRPNVYPTACRTCRRRGRKCDKTLPACQSCKDDRSVVCEGYVTRWAGVAARGRLRGKTIPVLLDKDTIDKRSVEKGSPSRTASSTALARWSPEAPRNRRRQSQDVSESQPDPAALVIKRIVPEPVDGVDSFIDYCESCRCLLRLGRIGISHHAVNTFHGRRRLSALRAPEDFSQLTTASIPSCL